MIDADKLAGIERALAKADTPATPDALLFMSIPEARKLLALARRGIADRALIEAHNARYLAECGVTTNGSHRVCRGGRVWHYSERCANCVQRHMIELPADDATKERT